MENPWNKLNPKQKKIATIILAFIGVNLFFVGIFLLVWRLFNPPCEMGQKRYKEYDGLCGPICKDTQEVCPKKDDKGNYVTINCVEKCPVGKTYDMGTCNEKTGYCKKSCKSPAVPVNTTRGWDCGIYCDNDSSDGFPDNYCMSTDVCGSTKNGINGKLISGCIGVDGEIENCPDSNFYCPKGTCKKYTSGPGPTPKLSGSYYCDVPMCNKTIFCQTDAKNNQCTNGGTCTTANKDTVGNLNKKGIKNIGTCSLNQTSNYEYCTDEKNIGIDSDGNAFACAPDNEGVSLVGNKQCDNALVGDNIPCCKYGLCPNGWQCNTSSDPKDTTNCAKNKTFDDFKLDDKVCCVGGEYLYTDEVSGLKLCCPDILTDGKCLNRNKYSIDTKWLGKSGVFGAECSSDRDCTEYEDDIKKKLPTIDFKDKNSDNYGKLFCNKKDPKDATGNCTLACGIVQKVSKDGKLQRDKPFISVNVEEDTVNNIQASSFCHPNDSNLFITSLQGKSFEYPKQTWNSQSSVPLDDNLLLCSTGEQDDRYFWAQNDSNKTGEAGNYNNEFKYIINSDKSEDCTKFPFINEDQIDAGNITINRDLLNQTGSVKSDNQTECTARIQCNLTESMGFSSQSQPFNWYQGNKSLAEVFPHGNGDMTQRVSKIMTGKCEDKPNPENAKDCDIGTPPDGFKDDQVASPCYYNSNFPDTCLSRNIGISQIPKGEHIDKDIKIGCPNNNNCLPHYIYNGEYCRYGTIDGKNCLPNPQNNNSC